MSDNRNQTECLLNAAMDHIAGTLEQPKDPRAWDHLLIYCPREAIERRAQRIGIPAQARPGCGAMRAQWTYDSEAHAYYFAPLQAAAPPYNTREVTAIIDIANDGTLAGVELIDNMPPPPSPLSSTERGCGHPSCKDPNCEYGKGPNTDPLSSTPRGDATRERLSPEDEAILFATGHLPEDF